MAHLHSIYDTDNHFTINPTTRAITTNSTKTLLMQYDHNSERFTFEIPRYIEGHDMSLCNQIEIHYDNISKNKKECNSDYYTVTDMQISPDSEDVVVFSWLITRASTQIVGKLNFSVTFSCISEDAETDYVWSTADYVGVKIEDKSYATEHLLNEHSDFVARMETLADDALECIQDYDKGIEQIAETVKTADSYIGEYEYKELLYEFTEDDFLEKIVLLENQISTYKDSNNIYQVTMPTHDWTGEDTYLIAINGEEYIKVTTSNYEYNSNGSTFVIDGHDINITADYFETAPTVSVIFVKDNKYVYKEIEDTDTFFNNDIQIEFELGRIFEDGSESTITALATRNEKVTTESYRRILFYENSCMSILSEWWYYPIVDVGDGFNTLSNAIESSIKNIWIGEWFCDEWDYNPVKTVRIYKLHKSLGSRIAELIDEINGEVV